MEPSYSPVIEESERDQDPLFNVHEIVWAKLKGFPWWPAKVNFLMIIIGYVGRGSQ